MQEKELLRIKGERKAFGTLEYYNVIGRTKRTHLKLAALSPKWGKYKNMTPGEVLNADKNNFAVNFEDIEFASGLLSGEIIVRN